MTARADVRVHSEVHIDLDDLKRRFKKAKVKVGFPVGQFEEDGVTSSASVAAKHEFGSFSEGIPERPFLRPAIRDNLSKYVAFNKRNMRLVINGDLRMMEALQLLGEMAAGDVKKKISAGPFTPLAPATIAARIRKRSPQYQRFLENRAQRTGGAIDKPLIDTGFMRQNVTYEIEGDGLS
jgi:hypothetical protein